MKNNVVLNRDGQLRLLRTSQRIFCFIGLPLLLAGLILLGRTALFVQAAHRADARVSKVESHRTSSSSGSRGASATVYRPTFEFVDASGSSRTVTLNHSSSEYGYSVGQRVPILYLSENPDRVRVASFFGVWGIALIVAGFGIGSCIFAGASAMAAKNVQKRGAERLGGPP